MRDKVILGVTLAIVLMLTLVIYAVVDAQRGPSTQKADQAVDIQQGKALYAQYCITCHGPLGEGCIGPALNRVTWRPYLPDGEVNPAFDTGSHDFMKKTIQRGRASNQPGIMMPMWSTAEGGPLNDQAIEQIISFIQYGDWNNTIEGAASAQNLGEPLPSFPGFGDPAKIAQVHDLMLSKGCLTCHTMGKAGGLIAAPLTDVGSRRSADWLRMWIKDPKSMPPDQRGPNLWLLTPVATEPVAASVPSKTPAGPTATPNYFPMNNTYMPTIPMTDDELSLLVDYLSKARTTP
jgi:mono/diheme cytochrome c family protein